MSSPLRRHWFRFSLRTMFAVVTVFAALLAYQINWIRDRRATIGHWESSRREALHPHAIVKAPGLLRLVGEPGYGVLWKDSPSRLTDDETSELARAKRLFPEAFVIWTVDGDIPEDQQR